MQDLAFVKFHSETGTEFCQIATQVVSIRAQNERAYLNPSKKFDVTSLSYSFIVWREQLYLAATNLNEKALGIIKDLESNMESLKLWREILTAVGADAILQ